MDSECASNGSHADMLKKEGLGDKSPNVPTAKTMCTAKCAKASGRCVLYNAATKDQRGLYWLVINQPAPAGNVTNAAGQDARWRSLEP